MISSLVTSLGGNGSGLEELEEEGLMEYNDVLLGTYLASLMKGLESSNQVGLFFLTLPREIDGVC